MYIGIKKHFRDDGRDYSKKNIDLHLQFNGFFSFLMLFSDPVSS